MLTLPIKKKWFDMILSGEKKEEYREIKDYWTQRFMRAIYGDYNPHHVGLFYGVLRETELGGKVILKNGYRADSPKIVCDCLLTIDTGKEEWGAEPNKNYYVLKIMKIEEAIK